MKQIRPTKTTVKSVVQMFSLFAALAFVAAGPLVACQKAEWREVKAINTGDPALEAQRGDLNPAAAQPGQTAYVAPDRLRGRSTPDQNPEESTRLLERGDQVQIVDPTPIGEDRLVSVRIVEQVPDVPVAQEPTPVQEPAATPAPVAQEITYVPAEYLQTTPVAQPVSDADRYIVIQNIATEKLRVYEVGTAGQPNRLVLETDMIAGENNPGKTRRTAVGSYKIVSWHKFYQDAAGLFPSWYDAQAPSLPLPGASLQDWTQKYFLPKGSSGLVRGAFGWYTAKLGPNAFAQWTHGTLGWGADRDRFIQLPKSQLAQFYSDPRSFGCTRVENQAIAYLQDLLPVGTKIIKIYAKEAARVQTATEGAPTSWEWILTKDGVRSMKPNSSARAAQLLRDVPSEQVLEQGVYKIDTTPNPVPFKKEVKGDRLSAVIIRPEANLYDLKESSFRGEFLVDEGRLVGYSHPKELRKGGYTDHLLPRAILK